MLQPMNTKSRFLYLAWYITTILYSKIISLSLVYLEIVDIFLQRSIPLFRNLAYKNFKCFIWPVQINFLFMIACTGS